MSPAEVRAALPAWAVVSERRVSHIGRVIAQLDGWAEALRTPAMERGRWRRAALLHDALRDAPEAVLRRWEILEGWPPKTWHGPAAAAAAAAGGERDRGVLDAVRYHSLGYAGWDDAGRMLYLADYLEPGRDYIRDRLDALAARVATDRDGVLREVAALRIGWRVEQRGRIARETWEFWNGLVAGPSGAAPSSSAS